MMNLFSWIVPALSLLSSNSTIKTQGDNPESRRPFTVLIEGNIGSGKSTLLRELATLDGVTSVQEPVDQWQNINGTNMLESLVKNESRWVTTFQLHSSYTRLNIALNSGLDYKVRLLERSLYSEFYCFVQYHNDRGNLSLGEYALLKKWFDFFTKYAKADLKVDLILYIRTNPQVLIDRIEKRGRKEEATINREFLTGIHSYHEAWLMHRKFPLPDAPVTVIDGNHSIEKTLEESLDAIRDALPAFQTVRPRSSQAVRPSSNLAASLRNNRAPRPSRNQAVSPISN